MFAYVQDLFQTARLRAQYQRRVQEQLLALVESPTPALPAEDPGRWYPLGEPGMGLNEETRIDARTRARRLARDNPHAANILRLLEIYVIGQGLRLTHAAMEPDGASPLAARADRLWLDFLRQNRRHFSFREYARRAWRDGETFLRCCDAESWPPRVRFVDPEEIGDPLDAEPVQGIETEEDDVESPLFYRRIDPVSRLLRELIPAGEILHTRLGADSNQKRGVTIFLPILDILRRFDTWLETELLARKLQASIVLWRKVQGGPSQAAAFADAAATSATGDPLQRRERLKAGTILTTSHGTDLQFLQPNTNFADAVPLGRLLLLCLAAGQGLPEFMLTADASNANFASTMVAEGPAVKLFEAEQQFFLGEFEQLWRWVMSTAIATNQMPEDFFDLVLPKWSTPQLVSRDRPRERLADVRLAEASILSRAEIARRDGADPARMRAEIADENTAPQGDL